MICFITYTVLVKIIIYYAPHSPLYSEQYSWKSARMMALVLMIDITAFLLTMRERKIEFRFASCKSLPDYVEVASAKLCVSVFSVFTATNEFFTG